MKDITVEDLRAIVREQVEWCEVLHQLVPNAKVREAYAAGQVAVYVTSEDSVVKGGPPRHRYLHIVSTEPVPEYAYSVMLKDESARWNALPEAERLAAAEARIGSRWAKQKLVDRLIKKGFLLKLN